MNDPQLWGSDLPAPDGRAVGVPEFLFEHAARLGDKPALVDGPTGRTLTYRQLAGAVGRVAAGLAARGFGKGDVLALPYSSGTTGLPKGVELTHANLVAQARQTQAVMGVTEDDVVVGMAPFFHAIGQSIILPTSLRAGATVVTMPRFDLAGFLGLIQEHRATFTIVVPPVVLALAGHPMVDDYDLSSLRLLGCGAAPLGADVEQRCADRLGCPVIQGFGMTEASAALAIVPPGAPRAGSAGRLLPGTEARIVDPVAGGDLGPGRTGELWLRGPQVMRGYRNRPEATAATLAPGGWLRTGDLCYVDADGYLFVVDRLKELIKYKGIQVAPAELEQL